MEVCSVVALKYIWRFSESVKSNSFSLKKIKKKFWLLCWVLIALLALSLAVMRA